MTDTIQPAKERWVEPEIRTLDVAETNVFGNRGRDGGKMSPDCTLS